MEVVVIGGTGYIGKYLTQQLAVQGYDVVVLTRNKSSITKPLSSSVEIKSISGYFSDELSEILKGSHAVINLAGADIGSKRWTTGRKAELYNSRVGTTSGIVGAIERLPEVERPNVLINASGIDYYGDRGDELINEVSSPGTSFLSDLCVQWESAARAADRFGLRVVTMRTALVIGPHARAIQLRLLPYHVFAGGSFMPGNQWFCWIHLEDLIGLYSIAITHDDIQGPVNAVSPGVLREDEAGKVFGRATGRPSWLRIPGRLIRVFLGERADLLLHGRHALPEKAISRGYEFKYRTLYEALTNKGYLSD